MKEGKSMKNVAVMIAEGSDEIEALTVVDILRRANVKCDIVSCLLYTSDAADE